MYKKKANELIESISKVYPKASFVLNPQKPRSKSFEVILTTKDQSLEDGHVVWTGLKKGPPRALKFPKHSQVIDSINSLMKE